MSTRMLPPTATTSVLFSQVLPKFMPHPIPKLHLIYIPRSDNIEDPIACGDAVLFHKCRRHHIYTIHIYIYTYIYIHNICIYNSTYTYTAALPILGPGETTPRGLCTGSPGDLTRSRPLYVCVYIYICISHMYCVYIYAVNNAIYIYIYIYMYIYIYTYIHTSVCMIGSH